MIVINHLSSFKVPLKFTNIDDRKVYISEFVVAKILGYVHHLKGHPKVTREFLLQLPQFLSNPIKILQKESRPKELYIICGKPTHRVVLEIKRNNNRTEINTIHRIRESTLKKLEEKCITM
jgi:hypothetical protein